MGSFRTITEVKDGFSVRVGANMYPIEEATFKTMEEVKAFLEDYCNRAYANTFENWKRHNDAKVAEYDRQIETLKLLRDAQALSSWPGDLKRRGNK